MELLRVSGRQMMGRRYKCGSRPRLSGILQAHLSLPPGVLQMMMRCQKERRKEMAYWG
jgi:hypothetical protein